MNTILALETASEACSVALLHQGRLLERFELAPRRHGALLLPFIDQLLAEAGVARSAIDAFAFGRGPGAFTGVRFAVSSAQGLALGLDRPLLAVSTLAALAQPLLDSGGVAKVAALLDARMGELYVGRFEADEQGLAAVHGEESLLAPEQLDAAALDGYCLAGSGLQAYHERIAGLHGGRARAWPELVWPRASAVARLGQRDLDQGLLLSPEQAEPVYLRNQVALTLAEQKSANKVASGSCPV